MRQSLSVSDPRTPTLGVIGGSGLYDFAELTDVERVRVATPFGDPSDEIVLGTLSGRRVAFLPRHGRGHRILPGELNFRANIHALKQLGVVRLVSIGAVGSLREEIVPGHLVVPDQFFDRSVGRVATFFGEGVVAHVQFGDPTCAGLRGPVATAAAATGATVHRGGTYVCMQGPQFSTRAESNFYRSIGGAVIGMTALQEAKLAREAEMCFASLALSTDYDCWHESEAEVDAGAILRVLHENADRARATVAGLAAALPEGDCGCHHALEGAIVTDRSTVPEATRRRLALVAGKYL